MSNHSLAYDWSLTTGHWLISGHLTTSNCSLASGHTSTSNSSSVNTYVASDGECANVQEPCTVNMGSGTIGAMCTDLWGQLPCTCLSYSSLIYISTGVVPLETIVVSEWGIASSDTDYTSMGLTGTNLCTLSGNGITQSYYSGSAPPGECSDGCLLDASRVRILFWPANGNNSTLQNISNTLGPLPYTTVSDGFTL